MANKIYGGVSGAGANLVTDLYGGSNNGAQKITKLYGPVVTTNTTVTGTISPRDGTVHSFNGSTFWNAVKDVVDASKTMDYLTVERAGGGYYMPALYYTDGSLDETYDGATFFTDLEMRSMGINTDPTEPATATITLTVETSTSSEAKLIHQGFGHNKYFGKVVYYTDNTYTTTAETLIGSQTELNSLRTTGSSTTWTVSIGGVTVGAQNIKEVYVWKDAVSIPNGFLQNCQRIDTVDLAKSNITKIANSFLNDCVNFNGTLLFPSSMTAVGDYFLRGCTTYNQPLPFNLEDVSIGYNFLDDCRSFNQPITIPSTWTKIPGGFLYSCYVFNQPITLPSQLTEIGDRFLGHCHTFNQPLTIPSTVTKIGDGFLYYCYVFNQQLILPSGIESIGDNFMDSAKVFNKPLTLPNGLLSIGESFLSGCESFNQDISLPNSLTSIGYAFMHRMKAMIGTISVGSIDAAIIGDDTTYFGSFTSPSLSYPAYASGIKISGANRQAWLNKFPNSSSGYIYRKLVDAGY